MQRSWGQDPGSIVGVITPTKYVIDLMEEARHPHAADRARLEGSEDRRLVAVALPPVDAAEHVAQLWGRGDAVSVLDVTAPEQERESRLKVIDPTHVLDEHGLRAVGGTPPAAGVSAVVVTSGTAAEAKAVELTFAGMRAAAEATHEVIGIEPDDRWLAAVPLHHVAGLAIVARSWVTGIPLTVLDRFTPQAVAEAAGLCTLVAVVPTMLARTLDAYAPMDRFRTILLGGGPIPTDLWRRAQNASAPVVTTYGMTETWGGVVYDGRPLPGVAVDLDEDGEILLDGPMLMRGYRHDAEATEAAFTDDGWFRTGDVGTFLGNGELRVMDRKKDLVITGGVNVSPSAVEDALHDLPSIAEVCVAANPDPTWGERVVAYVVPADASAPPSLEDLQHHVRDRLSNPELPRRLVLVDEIPRNANGKPLRRLLMRVN